MKKIQVEALIDELPIHMIKIINRLSFIPEIYNDPRWRRMTFSDFSEETGETIEKLKSSCSPLIKISHLNKWFNNILEILNCVDSESFGGDYLNKYDLISIGRLETIRNELAEKLIPNKEAPMLKKIREELDNVIERVSEEIFLREEKYLKKVIANEVKKEIDKEGGIILKLLDYDFIKYEKIFEEKVREKLKLFKENLKNSSPVKPDDTTEIEIKKCLEDAIKKTKEIALRKEDEIISRHWKEKMAWGDQIAEMERSQKEREIKLFTTYLTKLSEVDGKLITSQEKLKKTQKKLYKHKKANHHLYLVKEQTKGILYQKLRDLVAENNQLKNTRTFLIKQALKLSEDKIQAEEKLQQSETTLQTLAQENLFLNKQNQLQAQTITDLEAQIKTLQELANSELKSKNRQNTKLSDKNEDLEESLLKKIGGLVEEQNKTKKLTRVNKVRALIVEKLKSDLTNLKSELQTAQTEIKSLKIDKHHLEEQISLKKASKKDLYAKIRELKSSKKDQEQELTTSKEKITNQEKTIQQLETEKTNWTQEKGKWEQEKQQFLTKQNELLTEIELLKNPPVQGDNKETLKESMVVKEIIKEIIIKDLESNNLGLNLTSSEKTKLNNLTLSEIENYRNQLVKDKFNQLEKENKQLSRNGNKEVIQRERERESNSLNINQSFDNHHPAHLYYQKN